MLKVMEKGTKKNFVHDRRWLITGGLKTEFKFDDNIMEHLWKKTETTIPFLKLALMVKSRGMC